MLKRNHLATLLSVVLVAAANHSAIAQTTTHKQTKHVVCYPPSSPNINPLFFGKVDLTYSIPATPHGTIYGGAVPFGQVWLLGDQAPALVVNWPFLVNGQLIPAGTYSLLAIPQQGQWTLIVSKKTGGKITSYSGAGDDLLRTTMSVSPLADPANEFTISFESSSTSCTMNVDWATTRASVTLKAKSTDPPETILRTKPH
jgi:hypothetical protein